MRALRRGLTAALPDTRRHDRHPWLPAAPAALPALARRQALHQDPRLPDERVRLGQDGRRAGRQRRPGADRRDVEEADVILINTCSIREKAQEKVFSQLGRWKSLKQGGKPVVIGVGGCVASQEGEAIVKRAPYVDLVFGPQTLHRLPELIQRQARDRPAAGRHQLPRDREVRPPARAARRRPERLRLDHGRLQQVLLVLRGALHPRRGDQPSVRGRAGGSRRPRRAGRARGQPARPERQRLSRRRCYGDGEKSPTSAC